jgi:hypothetical protein
MVKEDQLIFKNSESDPGIGLVPQSKEFFFCRGKYMFLHFVLEGDDVVEVTIELWEEKHRASKTD